jgi:DNA-binding transcriptional ArsR family regulator
MLYAPLKAEEVRLVHRTLKDLCHENRLRIIELLLKIPELHVTELQEKLQLDQALVSHHLKILLRSKLVQIRRDGKFSYYRINQQKMLGLITALHFLRQGSSKYRLDEE